MVVIISIASFLYNLCDLFFPGVLSSSTYLLLLLVVMV